MKQYKFETLRSGNLVSSLTEMESFVNKYAKKGWDLKSIQHFPDMSTYLFIFTKTV